MRALLEIKSGERPYKMAVSDWFRDSDGAVVFKVISKKRKDGQIELVYYSQRGDSRKIVIDDIVIAEADFWKVKVMDLIKESLKEFFPKIKFKVENIDIGDYTQARVARADKFGVWRLLFTSWLQCQWMAFKTLFKRN